MNFLYSNKKEKISKIRLNILQLGIFLLIIIIIIRLFYIQIIKHKKYKELASHQHLVIKDIKPNRGEIFSLSSEDGDILIPLAVNQVYYEVNVDPLEITRFRNISDILAEILDLDSDEIYEKIRSKNKRYERILNNVSEEKIEVLKEKLNLLLEDINKDKSTKDKVNTTGVYWKKEVLRYYPDKDIGSHILGFLGFSKDGYSRVGKYGLEAYWEKELAGISGKIEGEKSLSGKLLSFTNNKSDVEHGADLILTIDHNIQYAACKSLERAVINYDAKSGTVIIMDTKTGSIKAMCNYPSFDPNKYNEVETSDIYNNNAVYYNYEPGSVMKSISMAIAIDTEKVSADTLYKDEGEIKFAGGWIIKNSDLKAHGLVDMTEVLAASLNTGIIFATSEIHNKVFEDYMKKFGFGELTGILISQDNKGDISKLSKKGDINKATASYGQGVTVTPLQMLNAINVLANSGNLVKPYIINKINYTDNIIETFEPEVIRRVVSSGTASTLSAMMVNVVDSGHAIKAGVDGYYVAGKTGTAQVVNKDTKRYDINKTIHNFVGFAPVENPKFTMITKLDSPTAARFSADTAAPLFGEIAKFLLEYYNIPPSR